MRDFIEMTDKDSGEKIIANLNHVIHVTEMEDGGSRLYTERHGGFEVEESYKEIKTLVKGYSVSGGFIEVTCSELGEKFMVNLKFITFSDTLRDGGSRLFADRFRAFEVSESYEEISEIVKVALK